MTGLLELSSNQHNLEIFKIIISTTKHKKSSFKLLMEIQNSYECSTLRQKRSEKSIVS